MQTRGCRRDDEFGEIIRPDEYLKAEEREKVEGQDMRTSSHLPSSGSGQSDPSACLPHYPGLARWTQSLAMPKRTLKRCFAAYSSRHSEVADGWGRESRSAEISAAVAVYQIRHRVRLQATAGKAGAPNTPVILNVATPLGDLQVTFVDTNAPPASDREEDEDELDELEVDPDGDLEMRHIASARPKRALVHCPSSPPSGTPTGLVSSVNLRFG
ncbi:MAG: hypothetical protein M1826_003834 [Phylliscum demangeonii]|nr:MAG: hypothetical protein M1826_003834 [Phylliscum demangeonii]